MALWVVARIRGGTDLFQQVLGVEKPGCKGGALCWAVANLEAQLIQTGTCGVLTDCERMMRGTRAAYVPAIAYYNCTWRADKPALVRFTSHYVPGEWMFLCLTATVPRFVGHIEATWRFWHSVGVVHGPLRLDWHVDGPGWVLPLTVAEHVRVRAWCAYAMSTCITVSTGWATCMAEVLANPAAGPLAHTLCLAALAIVVVRRRKDFRAHKSLLARLERCVRTDVLGWAAKMLPTRFTPQQLALIGACVAAVAEQRTPSDAEVTVQLGAVLLRAWGPGLGDGAAVKYDLTPLLLMLVRGDHRNSYCAYSGIAMVTDAEHGERPLPVEWDIPTDEATAALVRFYCGPTVVVDPREFLYGCQSGSLCRLDHRCFRVAERVSVSSVDPE